MASRITAQYEFPLSAFTSLSAANTFVNGLGNGARLLIDEPFTLTGNTTMTCPISVRGGLVTLGAFNLTLGPDFIAPDYMRVFAQTGSGIVSFSSATRVNITWWGADWTNNTNGAAQLLTRQACQNAALSLDSAQGGEIWCPPGIYRLDVGLPIVWRWGVWRAAPRTVRFDFDPATVPDDTTPPVLFPLANDAIFCLGNPVTRLRSGTTSNLVPGTNGVGTVDPTTVVYRAGWDGPDIISFNTTSMAANHFLSGIKFYFAQKGCFVRNARFIGLPNDGLLARFGSGEYENLICWLNGFYGPPSTHNGMSSSGWWDLTTPQLTSRGVRINNLDSRYNKDEGLECGLCADAMYSNIVFEGNQDKQLEGGTGLGQNISIWVAGQTCVAGGTPTIRYFNSPGIVYQCTSGGTSAAPGPVGTGTGITDGGGVVWKSIGVMPTENLPPEDLKFINIVGTGTWPSSVYVDGTAVTIIAPRGFARALSGFSVGSGNEGRYMARNVSMFAIGNTGTGSADGAFGIFGTNGLDIDVEGIIVDDFVNDSGHAVDLGQTQLPGPATGGSPRQTGRIRARIQTSRISTPGSPCVFISGCARLYDVAVVGDSTGVARNLVEFQVNGHGASTCPVDEIYFEGYGGAVTNSSVFISIPGNAAIGLVRMRNARLLGNNSGASASEGMVRLQGSGGAPTFTISEMVMEECVTSYAGATQFPIICVNVPNGAIGALRASNNKLDTGNFKLAFSLGNPGVINSPSAVANGNITGSQNGIPSQRVSYGTATPSTGDWSVGDTQYRLNAAAAGVVFETATTAGSFGTAYAGITGTTDGVTAAVTLNSTTNVNVGQWIAIATATGGPFRIVGLAGNVATLSKLPSAVAGQAVSLNATVFKSVSLSA